MSNSKRIVENLKFAKKIILYKKVNNSLGFSSISIANIHTHTGMHAKITCKNYSNDSDT